MPRIAATVLFALMLAGLQYRLWVADDGVIKTQRMRGEVASEEAGLAKLVSRNKALEAEVADLKTGGPAIEAYARNMLGMIRPGETFYLVVDPVSR